MRYSFSFVDQFRRCPFKWYLRYGLKTEVEDDGRPNHPFKIGHLLHTAVESGMQKATDDYYAKFPIIDDRHIEEVMKVEHYLPEVIDLFGRGKHEVQIRNDEFTGYIDFVEYNDDGTVNLYDFKYSNDIRGYKDSMQLHVYKYYYEMITGKKVKHLYYIFIPKVRVEYNMDVIERRNDLKSALEKSKVKKIEIEYDESKVDEFFRLIYEIENTTTMVKNESYMCRFCEYNNICQNVKINVDNQ